jgi:hypothetical protein
MIDIEKETAERLEKKGISKEVTKQLFTLKLINSQTAKRFLIVDEYESTAPCQGEKGHVKDQIADTFCVSSATVKLYTDKR